MNELRELARYVSRFNLEDASPEVLRSAKFCVLDTIGSALGAVRFEELPAISEELSCWISPASIRSAAVWGHGKRFDAFSALFFNAMLCHALELDDVHAGSKSHIGAVVVPAAWTLADALHSSGESFLEAVIVGYEAMARVGSAMDVASNRRRGWHSTGLIGTFGAAAAAARLLCLDEQRTLSAFGMAGTQSSGLWAFLAEGATCKKLHTARAAVNGLSAAVLANAGMTGPGRILDAPDGGLFPAVSDSFDMSVLSSDLGRSFQIQNIDKKPYPCCRSTHHAIDAALALRTAEGFAPDRIDRIQVRTYDVAILQCGSKKYPTNAVEAKFSIAYTCAAALAYGKVSFEEFEDEALMNPVVRDMACRITIIGDAEFTARYPKRWGCEVRMVMMDGQTLVRRIDDMSGSVNVPLSESQEKEKFVSLGSRAYNSKDRVRSLMQEILAVDARGHLPDLS